MIHSVEPIFLTCRSRNVAFFAFQQIFVALHTPHVQSHHVLHFFPMAIYLFTHIYLFLPFILPYLQHTMFFPLNLIRWVYHRY